MNTPYAAKLFLFYIRYVEPKKKWTVNSKIISHMFILKLQVGTNEIKKVIALFSAFNNGFDS